MTIYLHNCTQGQLEICYRGDYTPPGRDATQRERQGFKRVILKEWGPGSIEVPAGADLTDLLDQMKCAGGIATGDPLPHGTTASFIYDVIKRPTLAERDRVVKHNRGIKTDEGATRRRNAAISVDNMLMQNLVDRGLPGDMRPPETTVEFEQTEESEQDDRGRLTEGFNVKPDPGRRSGGGGRRAARAHS